MGNQRPLLLVTPAAPISMTPNVARRVTSPGGPAPARGPWATAPGVIPGDRERMPSNINDTLIRRERMPWLHQTTMIQPGDGWFDWTRSGPRRAPLHMRDVTISRMQGSSNTRNQDPIPTGFGTNDGTNIGWMSGNGAVHGLHTRPVTTKPQTVNATRKKAGVAEMKNGRQNRLSNSRGNGQSYSQTTIHQGGTK